MAEAPLDGHGWNHKRLYRVYRALRLNLPRRRVAVFPPRVRQTALRASLSNLGASSGSLSSELAHAPRLGEKVHVFLELLERRLGLSDEPGRFVG